MKMHQYESEALLGVDRTGSRGDPSGVHDVIKQETHLAAKSCLDPLGTNGYGLPNGSRDTWASFRDGFGLSTSPDTKMAANMAVSSNGQLGQLTSMDWTGMTSRGQTASSQYYSPPLAHAQTAYGHPHPYAGWTDSSHAHAQSAYAYGMTSPHATYRQPETSGTSYPYSPFGGASSLTPPSVGKDSLGVSPSIQDMDAERTIRRARRNRTCFSKHQLESLEEVFKESRYPDVYRREEIAAQLDLKEEVVRVWFKNRRAKMKRENKDGKVASPGSPTSTTPSPKTSTSSPPFPTTPLYTSYSSTPTPAYSTPKQDHLTTSNPYFPSPYPSYPHSTNSLAAHGPIDPKTHLTVNSTAHAHSVTDSTYSGHSDVTSSYSIKCEPSEGRDFRTSPLNGAGSVGIERTATPTSSSTQATQSPNSDN